MTMQVANHAFACGVDTHAHRTLRAGTWRRSSVCTRTHNRVAYHSKVVTIGERLAWQH